MAHQFQITEFRAQHLQALRNVTIHSPSIIQILSGNKRLFWQEESVTLTPDSLILCSAASSWNFANLPEKGPFLSRVFSFHYLPNQEMLGLSESAAHSSNSSYCLVDKPIRDTLNTLAMINLKAMSPRTQQYWLMPLYQQLAEQGALHKIFRSSQASLTQTITQYLSIAPADEHSLEDVADHFGMSRATLIRKLKQEGSQYRQLLAQVRLSHALQLMQKHQYDGYQLAQMCGYQSEERFRQRFKERFGVTPREYQRTIGNEH
ncbi:helix-turn-helix transcriptional regulator [Vibrio coralliilyticus]|uniref:helix-turn-helix transcriptional regulator n=1 Tax=Vibrio coralliilyticus TaxID=190893 RepID=UPI000BAAAF34|nr:helix-turn-helix transcriptional regulator [Vibrio coralliilyticus]NOI57045.1 helix-turn-helix transcriptional regulator [Vibrio coralliilyticus]PAT68612.1 AraC family transcriptional regulator [Vibrio coralliilyticus]